MCTYVYTFPATFNTLRGESNPKIILDFFNNIVMQYTFVKNSSAMGYTWQSWFWHIVISNHIN